MGQSEDRLCNCMKAIRAAQEALRIFNLEDSPEDYNDAQGTLWLAYLTIAEIEYRLENCLLALEACQERLRVFSVADRPLEYASCQKDMAITCSMLADAEISAEAKAIDCKRGVDAAMEALRIYDEKESSSGAC